MNMKKLFLLNLPYLLFVYPFDKLAQAFRLAPGADLSGKLLSIGDGFTAALSSPWLSFHPTDLLIGIAGAVFLRMAVYLKGKTPRNTATGSSMVLPAGVRRRISPLHGQGLFPKHPHDADGTDHDGEPPQAAEVCQK